MRETWKETLEGFYEVSDFGIVRRLKPGKGTWVGRVLKSGRGKQGYKCMQFQKRTHYVHQLVAKAFIGPCPLGKEVNHKDGDKGNNKAKNLEYITHQKNIIHAYLTKLQLPSYGEAHGMAKLTVSKVIQIRKSYASGKVFQQELAKELGVSVATISDIVTKRSWKHVA